MVNLLNLESWQIPSLNQLPPNGKEEIGAGKRIAESEHQMSAFMVIASVPVDIRMVFCISIPLLPGSPMAFVIVTVFIMVMVPVVTAFPVGAF